MLSGQRKGEIFPHLRVLFLCGESANGADLEGYRAHCGSACLFVNCLGSTECATVTLYFSDRDAAAEPGVLPIGSPVDDMEVQLVNEVGDVITGVGAGEIVVRSRYLARGYVHDPTNTAKAFQEDPRDATLRRYFSGDIGRRLEDGNLICLGRKDHQIKIRGHRIELGEIEETLSGHPLVQQAVVVVGDDTPDQTRLLAYVAAEQGASLSTNDLHSYVRNKLPLSMVPSEFVLLATLPLTPNGKIDRKVLPRLDASGTALRHSHVAPRDALERQLAMLWESVLGKKPIGIHADFFAVGGHSLLAARLFSRMKKDLGIHLPLATLLN